MLLLFQIQFFLIQFFFFIFQKFYFKIFMSAFGDSSNVTRSSRRFFGVCHGFLAKSVCSISRIMHCHVPCVLASGFKLFGRYSDAHAVTLFRANKRTDFINPRSRRRLDFDKVFYFVPIAG